MNLKCLICSDIFTPHAEIYGTTCGHLFHYHCLLQWIDRSKTCPQCRTKSTEKTIHRIFLSIEENVETTDISVLQNKLDNVQFQLKLKEKDVKNSEENYKVASKQNGLLREEVKTLEGKMKILESAMHALKEQVTYFKTKSKNVSKLEDELLSLKTKLNDFNQMKVILDGNQQELNDMMRNNQDVHSLSILVVTLKKQLIDTEKSKNQLQSTTKNLQAEIHYYRKKIRNLTDERSRILKENEDHKNCFKERECLKNKITELKSRESMRSSSSENDLTRIVTESPLPLSRLHGSDKRSPSVLDVVTSIKDSNSPYLRVQTSSIGLSGLVNYNNTSNDTESNKSIFKQPSLRVHTLKRPLSLNSYDGLGGHSKEEHLPTPKHEIPTKKLKSSSSVTSLKFKKLAGSQQKLNFSKPT